MIEKIAQIAKNPLIAATEHIHTAGIMSFMSHNQAN